MNKIEEIVDLAVKDAMSSFGDIPDGRGLNREKRYDNRMGDAASVQLRRSIDGKNRYISIHLWLINSTMAVKLESPPSENSPLVANIAGREYRVTDYNEEAFLYFADKFGGELRESLQRTAGKISDF